MRWSCARKIRSKWTKYSKVDTCVGAEYPAPEINDVAIFIHKEDKRFKQKRLEIPRALSLTHADKNKRKWAKISEQRVREALETSTSKLKAQSRTAGVLSLAAPPCTARICEIGNPSTYDLHDSGTGRKQLKEILQVDNERWTGKRGGSLVRLVVPSLIVQP